MLTLRYLVVPCGWWRRRRRGRLTGQDISSLSYDELGWPQDIGLIAVLDGATLLDLDGDVRVGEIRRAIAGRLHLAPRLRQVHC